MLSLNQKTILNKNYAKIISLKASEEARKEGKSTHFSRNFHDFEEARQRIPLENNIIMTSSPESTNTHSDWSIFGDVTRRPFPHCFHFDNKLPTLSVYFWEWRILSNFNCATVPNDKLNYHLININHNLSIKLIIFKSKRSYSWRS